jgi:hypothetical protein
MGKLKDKAASDYRKIMAASKARKAISGVATDYSPSAAKVFNIINKRRTRYISVDGNLRHAGKIGETQGWAEFNESQAIGAAEDRARNMSERLRKPPKKKD